VCVFCARKTYLVIVNIPLSCFTSIKQLKKKKKDHTTGAIQCIDLYWETVLKSKVDRKTASSVYKRD